MTINLDITIENEAKDYLDILHKEINQFEKPLNDSAQYMQVQAISNFAARGALMQEGGWKDLSKRTKKIKIKKVGFVYPMLVRTNLLRSSFKISEPVISGNSGKIEVYNPTPYAIEHQEGVKEKRLSQRIILRFMKQQIEDITNIFNRWLDNIINK